MFKQMKLISEVLNNGMTIEECRKTDEASYNKWASKISMARNEYLVKNRPQSFRTNYFVTGGTDEGRKNACIYMAEAIAEKIGKSISDPVFTIKEGAQPSVYDGQPTVYFEEASPAFLSESLGQKKDVLNFLNPTAEKKDRCFCEKYGIYLPCNEVTIISSARPFDGYIQTLANCIDGTKKQLFARFDAYIVINDAAAEDLSYFVNVGHAIKDVSLCDQFAEVKEKDGKTWFSCNGKDYFGR